MRVESGSNVRRGLGSVHGAQDDATDGTPQLGANSVGKAPPAGAAREQTLENGIDANETQGRAGRALLDGKSGSTSSSHFELNLPYDPYEPELGEKPWKDIPFMLDGAAGEAMAQLSANMNAAQQGRGNENPVQLAAMGDQAPDAKVKVAAANDLREQERKSLDINDMLSSQRVQGLRGTTAGRY